MIGRDDCVIWNDMYLKFFFFQIVEVFVWNYEKYVNKQSLDYVVNWEKGY